MRAAMEPWGWMKQEPTSTRATGRSTLLWTVFLANAAVLLIAAIVLAVSPATVSSPIALAELAALAVGFGILLFLNLFLLRRAFSPLDRLTAEMHRVDLMRPGRRVPEYGDQREILELTEAFNGMLERLEDERLQSVRVALGAQESERRRVAQELHDEIGQSLTAIVLRVEAALRQQGEVSREDLHQVQAIAEASVDELRGIARRLRPEMLDDLGLAAALVALSERVSETGELEVRRSLARDLPELRDEVSLVIYRVAQESLTNVVRHSGARMAWLTLDAQRDAITLTVEDDGAGMDGASPGTGIQGMLERAVLVGARLDIDHGPRGGVQVRLDVPLRSPEGSRG
jgi:two-component system sensor histidine kinase UhpB